MNGKRYAIQRKITALVLSVMLILALTACGDNTPAGSDVTATPTAAVTTPGTDPSSEPDATPTEAVQGSNLGTAELTGSSGTAPATKPMDETMRAAYAEFAYRMFTACAKGEGKSCLVSPFSAYTALAMLANGADGNTAAQIDSVLGVDEKTRNAYMAAWIKELTGQDRVVFSCADSIWVANLFRDAVPDTFLAACADSYRAEVFAADMNDGTVDDINAWTAKSTDGMISKIFEHGDLNMATVAILINAITMDAKWEDPFTDDRIDTNGTFTHANGTTETVTMMSGSADRRYLENDLFTGCVKSYKGGEFRYVALLPKEGVSMADALASLNPKSVDALFSGFVSSRVDVCIPKYQVEYSKELQGVLADLGMSDLFNPGKADLSRMVTRGTNYVDRVIHKTYLSLDNEGTRAAAVTAISVRNLSIEVEEYYRVVLDRPFIYMIVDGNNLPLFIGTYQ